MKKYLKTFKDKWRLIAVILFFLVMWFVFGTLLLIKGHTMEDFFMGAAYAFGLTLFADLTAGVGRENRLFPKSFYENKH